MLRLSPDGHELAGLRPVGRLLGITGAPGSGKSTLAHAVATAYGAVMVPMDGFHLSDAELARRGLLDRKGAPATFDAQGYATLLALIRTRPDHAVMAPGFDRDREETVPDAIPVPPSAELVVTEGNYLLLDVPEWRAVRKQLDVVWHVVTDEKVREERLDARHVHHGRSPAAAREWVQRVDRPNAVLIEACAHRADLVLDLTDWAGPGSP